MSDSTMRKHMNERFGKVFNYTLNPPLPASLNIELNNTCNQKCVFCPFHGPYAIREPKPAMLDKMFVKDILDQAQKLGIGNKELGFYLAGEPFLYKDLVELIRYAKDKGFPYVFLTSNGALATEELLVSAVEAGLDSIRFSVNGGDPETYRKIHQTDDFERVKNSIRFLDEYRKEHGIHISLSLSCVLTKKTMYTKEDIEKTFSQYVDDILFIPVMLSRLQGVQSLREEYELMDDSGDIDPDFVCPMLFDTMYINAFGKVVPCCDAYDGNVEFSDLRKNFDLEKAWKSAGYEKYRRIFTHGDSDEGTICSVCVLRRKGHKRLSFEG